MILISHKADTAFFIPHAQREQGMCDPGWCPFIYMYVCVCPKKFKMAL